MTRNQRGCRGRGGDPEAVARDGAGPRGPASTSPVASQPQTSAGSTTATGHSSPGPAAASDTQAKPSHQSSPQLLTVHRLHCPFCLCHPPFYKTFLGSRVNRTTGEPEPISWLRLPNCVSASQSCVNATALRAFQVHFARVHPGLNWKPDFDFMPSKTAAHDRQFHPHQGHHPESTPWPESARQKCYPGSSHPPPPPPPPPHQHRQRRWQQPHHPHHHYQQQQQQQHGSEVNAGWWCSQHGPPQHGPQAGCWFSQHGPPPPIQAQQLWPCTWEGDCVHPVSDHMGAMPFFCMCELCAHSVAHEHTPWCGLQAWETVAAFYGGAPMWHMGPLVDTRGVHAASMPAWGITGAMQVAAEQAAYTVLTSLPPPPQHMSQPERDCHARYAPETCGRGSRAQQGAAGVTPQRQSQPQPPPQLSQQGAPGVKSQAQPQPQPQPAHPPQPQTTQTTQPISKPTSPVSGAPSRTQGPARDLQGGDPTSTTATFSSTGALQTPSPPPGAPMHRVMAAVVAAGAGTPQPQQPQTQLPADRRGVAAVGASGQQPAQGAADCTALPPSLHSPHTQRPTDATPSVIQPSPFMTPLQAPAAELPAPCPDLSSAHTQPPWLPRLPSSLSLTYPPSPSSSAGPPPSSSPLTPLPRLPSSLSFTYPSAPKAPLQPPAAQLPAGSRTQSPAAKQAPSPPRPSLPRLPSSLSLSTPSTPQRSPRAPVMHSCGSPRLQPAELAEQELQTSGPGQHPWHTNNMPGPSPSTILGTEDIDQTWMGYDTSARLACGAQDVGTLVATAMERASGNTSWIQFHNAWRDMEVRTAQGSFRLVHR